MLIVHSASFHAHAIAPSGLAISFFVFLFFEFAADYITVVLINACVTVFAHVFSYLSNQIHDTRILGLPAQRRDFQAMDITSNGRARGADDLSGAGDRLYI